MYTAEARTDGLEESDNEERDEGERVMLGAACEIKVLYRLAGSLEANGGASGD